MKISFLFFFLFRSPIQAMPKLRLLLEHLFHHRRRFFFFSVTSLCSQLVSVTAFYVAVTKLLLCRHRLCRRDKQIKCYEQVQCHGTHLAIILERIRFLDLLIETILSCLAR